ncbi:endonuclease/exonuclease/phosphatase family protein [Bacteroidota bacterium]
MTITPVLTGAIAFILFFGLFEDAFPQSGSLEPLVLRVATFNIGDVRTEDLSDLDHPRLTRIAEEIRELRPDIILLNEIAYDWPSDSVEAGGTNGQKFVDKYLPDAGPDEVAYRALMFSPNTGVSSGYDLDRNGDTVSVIPQIPEGSRDGSPGAQTAQGRAYGADSWGFGMFPGQFGFALLVSEQLEILTEEVRTFQYFRWSALPEPLRPVDPESGKSWYDERAWQAFRLSSKTHVDVPVLVSPGTVIHVLASHPTPPVFDGPEQRNKKRNHDEIRFWKYYLDGAAFIEDDNGKAGGLESTAQFVIVGDLNADPQNGDSYNNPIGTFLLDHPRVKGAVAPRADAEVEGLDAEDTAQWGLRVDYILPSAGLNSIGGAVHRHVWPEGVLAPSDHFPVWIDLEIPTASP